MASKIEEAWAKSVAALEEVAVMAKAHVAQYVRKDGSVVREHDDGRAAKAGYVAPKEGEVGYHEHQTYGKYFRKGDKVRDNFGNTHEVIEHRGASVSTYSGQSFHPTKLHHVS